MRDTKIEWADATWNPIRGCSRISKGCEGCYAEVIAGRFSGAGLPYAGTITNTSSGPRWNGRIKFIDQALDLPLRWQRPQRIFVNSMSDLFHENLSNAAVAAVFGVMAMAPRHTFLVLTKRAKRMREWFEWIGGDADGGTWGCILHARDALGFRREARHEPLDDGTTWPLPNVWIGISVEDQPAANERIKHLLNCPAAVHWISAEPLLGPLDIAKWLRPWGPDAFGFQSDKRLSWVVAGGESGPKARPMHPAWALSLRDQCNEAGVAFHFKQWGAWAPVAEEKIHPDAIRVYGNLCRCVSAHRPDYYSAVSADGNTRYRIERVGKRAAGRMLDGRTWDEVPR